MDSTHPSARASRLRVYALIVQVAAENDWALPSQINFIDRADVLSIGFEHSAEMQQWLTFFQLTAREPHPDSNSNTMICTAYGIWEGWHVQMVAYDPITPKASTSDGLFAAGVAAAALAKAQS